MSNKKLSTSKLDRILKQEKLESINTIEYEINDKPHVITVKSCINLSEMLGFVDGVLGAVFYNMDDGATQYVPAILEYAKALHYIEFFTNLPEEIGSERVYTMLFGSDIMRKIYKLINPAQYNAIEEAIESAIAHKLAILQAGEEAKIVDAANKIDKASDALSELTKQFEGVGQEKMHEIFNNLSSISSRDLVGAVIEARAQK